MSPAATQEHRLAIMTGWGLLGSLGLCFILSGFSVGDPTMGLAGFAIVVAGFVAHLVINRIFKTGFTPPQVALALTTFIVALVSFIASCLFDPAFGQTNIVVGLIGFGALTACFVAYLMINYGVRGGYAMVHRSHLREPSGS